MQLLRMMIVLAVLFVLGWSGGAASASASGPVPGDFVARVTNPWFPLIPGTIFVYRGVKDGKSARDVVTVTHSTKRIQGVLCTAVADRLYLAGRLEERTTDWYAQDRRGNVWYFGESTAELDRAGHVTSTEGSWQAGRDGAQAGIYMTASPAVGQSRRQEYYKGHANDHFAVVSLSAHVSVPFTTSNRALLTKEWTPLEPGTLDHKYYLRGIGNVKEVTVKGATERNELVSVRRP
ncbi:MAG TPA: hypothetical protein VKD88_06120 [Gaiellaceae bacterium]|nr:hypothetical protein [Gaiellaceae bacterium]